MIHSISDANIMLPKVFMEIQGKDGTVRGRIVMDIFIDKVPKAGYNFITLCTGKNPFELSYQGSEFFCDERFCVQGGKTIKSPIDMQMFLDMFHQEPKSSYYSYFEQEKPWVKHQGIGTVAMNGKNENGCEFYITVEDTPWLDLQHTVIGKVRPASIKVLGKIQGGDVIRVCGLA